MAHLHRVTVLSMAAIAASACSQLQTLADRDATAAVTLNSVSGEIRGGGEIWQDKNGQVHVNLQVQGLTPGVHAIHFHAVGKCDQNSSPAFGSAGGHYNPASREHGLDNPAGPHAGDAPNFTVGSSGTAQVQFVTSRVSITAGAATLLDADGSALVVHAAADDHVSQPAGNSGERVACGIVYRVM